ncbi:MAG TPA: hypothetical protein VJN70_00740 [Gemmatimonadaceae bacterium]|nr:hypothetical protein [Gemmatimonadaceae bacterium]
MYSTCLFCNANLATNEVIESFPIGRRLAFDAANGRLWVVCRKCERWNLSPLEERWEAIEACERCFRDTRLRVSTDNIGLARLREGLELVRVGPALRPEFAAWRYGDQFGRRRRRQMVRVGLGVGIVGGAIAGGIALGVSAGVGFGSGGWWIWRGIYASYRRIAYGSQDAIVARIPYEDKQQVQRVAAVRRRDLPEVRLGRTDTRGLLLSIPLRGDVLHLTGEEAERGAGYILPAINWAGAEKREVEHAVQLIEESQKPPSEFVQELVSRSVGRRLEEMPSASRLALEMASHEESERRAMEGELAVLEAAWRQAEEIAKIADNLLVPPSVDEFLERNRAKD